MTVAIHTEGLTKFYGKDRGIVDLDLDVDQGEVFGYLGPNGAGKTTTIRLLLDLSATDAGHQPGSRQTSVLRRESGSVPTSDTCPANWRSTGTCPASRCLPTSPTCGR